MPTKWDLTNKTATNAPVIEPVPIANSPAILITENLVAILDASSKHIYRLLLEKKQTTPTTKENNMVIDWKNVQLFVIFPHNIGIKT